MPRYVVPVIASVVLIAAVTVVEGIFSERWETRPPSPEEEVFAARIKQIPTKFDEWTSTDEPISQAELEAARASGNYSRSFQSRLDPTKVVKILILTGSPTDMTRHTPEKCYLASGFEGETDNIVFPIDYDKDVATFYTNKFRKGELGQAVQHLRIFWSFSADGNWAAKSKVQLESYPAICKIYAITEVPANSPGEPGDSAAVGFLHRFLPVINATLFPPDAKSVPSTAGEKPAGEKPVAETAPSNSPAQGTAAEPPAPAKQP